MTAITDLLPGLAAPEATKSRAGSPDELGQKDFLKLMMAQLKHQDPMKPTDNAEFFAQIAQFSTVSGLQDLQSSFTSLANDLRASQTLQAAGLVDRSVLIPSTQAVKGAETPLEGAVDLLEPVEQLVVQVTNPAGEVVHMQNLGRQSAGLVEFEWNGVGNDGQSHPEGTYRISAEALIGGATQMQKTLAVAPVEGVTLGRGGASLELGLGPLGTAPLVDVYRIL